MGVESNISPELKAKLLAIEARSAPQQQLATLRDLADISQEILNVLDRVQTNGATATQGFGALLADMRECLLQLKDKDEPEIPDYAKPVVEAVTKLEKALTASLKKIDVKPQFKPEIKVDSPKVSVTAPDVDLRGVEKILKSDLPKAFENAVKKLPKTEIPKTDFEPVVDQLEKMATQLESIDTGTRLKPQFPNTIKVTNPDGSTIAGSTSSEYAVEAQSDATYDYFAFADPGTALGSAAWKAIRIESDGTKRYADGNANFDNVATDLTALVYS